MAQNFPPILHLAEIREMYTKLYTLLESHKKMIVENIEHFKQVDYHIFPVDIMKDMVETLQAMIQLQLDARLGSASKSQVHTNLHCSDFSMSQSRPPSTKR